MAIYYIDTVSFDLATAVWAESTLTAKAPDGFYSFGGDYREQVGGLLGATISCLPANIPLDWSFSEINGTGEMILYINDVPVVTRNVTDLGTYIVNVGDEIRVSVSTQSCSPPNIKAVSVSTGIIAGDACADASVTYDSATYFVTSMDLGTTLSLDTYSECSNICLV